MPLNLEDILSLNLNPPYYILLALLILFLINVILLILYFTLKGEYRRLEKRLRRLVEIGNEQDLFTWLERFRDLSDMKKAIEKTGQRVEDLQQKWENALSRVGIVRFNPFPDVGSDLSFAVALLDMRGNGFILTNLYSREESRVFIKPVQQGKSSYRLSEEEERAIALALGELPFPEQ
ncbi:MAG: hypothetical protein PWP65_1564 [Clostridia bacterium]|nr:hypothetical protein [Clostridia bacterium]